MNKTTALSTRVEKRGLRPGRKASRMTSVSRKKEEKVRAAVAASHESPPVLDFPSRDGICCHFWVIDLVLGPTSHGVCKRCDEQRQFSNYLRASGMLPEKDMSRLSDVREPAGGDIDGVVLKHTGGYVAASAGAPGYTRKPWPYPRKGRGLVPR